MTATKTTTNTNKATATTKRRVLIALTSHSQKGSTGQKTGAYLAEVAHPTFVFRAAGFDVDFVSVKGGAVPLDGVDRADADNARFLDDAALMHQVTHTPRAEDVDVDAYDAVFYAGGHGTMWDFPQWAALADKAARLYDKGGVVGAVCHGPAGLLPITLNSGDPLVKGKAVAAFTNDEERAVKLEGVVPFLLADALEARGAAHKPAGLWQKQVVVSERLVTGQNPASAAGVAAAMVELLR